jgi:hypothetical protein
MKFASDRAARQCETLGVVATDPTFKAAIADIAWSKLHAGDQRAAFLHPDPGSRETWRVMLGGVEVDVLFAPMPGSILGVSMVRGYVRASARSAPPALETATVQRVPPAPASRVGPGHPPTRAPTANSWDWTPARDAVLTQHWPTYKPRPEIDAMLRRLPGRVGAKETISIHANQTLGLRRPADFMEVSRPPSQTRETNAQRAARIATRDDIVRRGYADGLSDKQILALVHQASPLFARLIVGDIAGLAKSMGLSRPQEALEPLMAPEDQHAALEPSPPPAAAVTPADAVEAKDIDTTYTPVSGGPAEIDAKGLTSADTHGEPPGDFADLLAGCFEETDPRPNDIMPHAPYADVREASPAAPLPPTTDDAAETFLARLVTEEWRLVRRLDAVRKLIQAYRDIADEDGRPVTPAVG